MYELLLFVLDFAGWMAIIGAVCAITMLVGVMLMWVIGAILNKLEQVVEFLSRGER